MRVRIASRIKDLPYIEEMIKIIDENMEMIRPLRNIELIAERTKWLGLICRIRKNCEQLEIARKVKIGKVKKQQESLEKRRGTIAFKKTPEYQKQLERVEVMVREYTENKIK